MNLIRQFNIYCQRPSKVRIPLIVIVITVLLTLMWFWGKSGKKFNLFCSSERNLRHSNLFKTIGVNVIPSLPVRGEMFVEAPIDNFTENVIDPFENECLNVKSTEKFDEYKICIHDPYRDVIVSAHLKEEGYWEQESVEAIHKAYQWFPDILLVDLGCHIGVFTLAAGTIGLEVVAVDAMLDSLKLLQRSLLINNLACHVTLLHNAIHHKRTQVRLVVDPINIGGARVIEFDENHKSNSGNSNLVDAICLDHLVPLVKGKTVFLKMDLEGAEGACFHCAEEFFRQVNVKVILLEWTYLRHNQEDNAFVKTFLTLQNMFPVSSLASDRVIDLYASHSWPDRVYWLARD